jgi:phosphoglycolate phosphatase-like HAD superfamily hydrolase
MFYTNKKVVVFDFDGVIVDSNKIKYDAFFAIWSGHVSKYRVKESLLIGGDRTKVIGRLYESSDKSSHIDYKLEHLVNKYSKIVHEEILKIGVSKNVLNFLMNTNKKIFINSATPQIELIQLCNDLKINQYFAGIFGSPKSKKANFNIIFDNYNTTFEQIAFFGDMQSDQDVADEMNIDFYKIFSKESDFI